jgi:hypothetical protein
VLTWQFHWERIRGFVCRSSKASGDIVGSDLGPLNLAAGLVRSRPPVYASDHPAHLRFGGFEPGSVGVVHFCDQRIDYSLRLPDNVPLDCAAGGLRGLGTALSRSPLSHSISYWGFQTPLLTLAAASFRGAPSRSLVARPVNPRLKQIGLIAIFK